MSQEDIVCPCCGQPWSKRRPLQEAIPAEAKEDQTDQEEDEEVEPKKTVPVVDYETKRIVKCPQCGCLRVWRDSKYFTAKGEDLQRYLCRECGYRFTKF